MLRPNPLSVPPPVLVTDTNCDPGLEPPACALNVTLVGDNPIAGAGGAAVTVNVTLTVWGLLPATPEVTDTVAVYVPAARLPVVADNINNAGAVVPPRLATNHPDAPPP